LVDFIDAADLRILIQSFEIATAVILLTGTQIAWQYV